MFRRATFRRAGPSASRDLGSTFGYGNSVSPYLCRPSSWGIALCSLGVWARLPPVGQGKVGGEVDVARCGRRGAAATGLALSMIW